MIAQIAHAAFRVKDVDASVAFYARLGIPEAFRLHGDDGSLRLIYLQVNANQFIELFPGGTDPVELTPRSIGYAHYCFEVDDLEKTVAELAARGIALDRPITTGRSGNLQAWIVDPDGNRIELMQTLPSSQQAQAAARYEASIR